MWTFCSCNWADANLSPFTLTFANNALFCRAITELTEELKIKSEEGDAYISEIEVWFFSLGSLLHYLRRGYWFHKTDQLTSVGTVFASWHAVMLLSFLLTEITLLVRLLDKLMKICRLKIKDYFNKSQSGMITILRSLDLACTFAHHVYMLLACLPTSGHLNVWCTTQHQFMRWVIGTCLIWHWWAM